MNRKIGLVDIADEMTRECEKGTSVDVTFEKDNMFGKLKIGDAEFSVYLGNMHAEYVCGQIKRVFTLIER